MERSRASVDVGGTHNVLALLILGWGNPKTTDGHLRCKLEVNSCGK